MATMTTSTRIAGVGVALTSSSTPDDDRVRFPSAPGPSTADKSPNAITHLLSSKRESVDVDNLLHRKPGDRSSLKLISDAWEVDRRRTSQQTEQKKGSKSLQSEESKSGSSSSPLMAELKSNVIVRPHRSLLDRLILHIELLLTVKRATDQGRVHPCYRPLTPPRSMLLSIQGPCHA